MKDDEFENIMDIWASYEIKSAPQLHPTQEMYQMVEAKKRKVIFPFYIRWALVGIVAASIMLLAILRPVIFHPSEPPGQKKGHRRGGHTDKGPAMRRGHGQKRGHGPKKVPISFKNLIFYYQKQEFQFEALSTLEQVLERYIRAVGGRVAIEKLTTRVCTGRLIHDLHWRQPPYEVVPFEGYAKNPDKLFVIEQTSGGIHREGCDGKTGWRQNADSIEQENQPKRSKFAWLLNPQNALRLSDYFPGMVLKGRESLEGRAVYVVEPTGLNEAHCALYFDIKTGLLIRIGYYWELQDYREVDGVKFPFRIAMSRKGGSSTYVFDEVKHNVPVDDALFTAPADAIDTRLVSANTDFGFKLFAELVKQMAKTLELQGMKLAEVNQANAALTAMLKSPDRDVQLDKDLLKHSILNLPFPQKKN